MSCTLVVDRVSTRVVRYSSFVVRLFRNVTSMPSSGLNDSLMEAVEMLYMLEGVGLPVVASVTKPSPSMYSW